MRFGLEFLYKKDLPVLSQEQANMLTKEQQKNDFIVLSNEQSNDVDIIYNDFLEIIDFIKNNKFLEGQLNSWKTFEGKIPMRKKLEEYNTKVEEIRSDYLVNKNINDNILFIVAFRRLVYNNLSEAKLLLSFFIKQTTFKAINMFSDRELSDAIRRSNSEDIGDWFVELLWFNHSK
jgi:hypothetical protein